MKSASAPGILYKVSRWWAETHDRRQEAELALALAIVAAAVITASLKSVFERL